MLSVLSQLTPLRTLYDSHKVRYESVHRTVGKIVLAWHHRWDSEKRRYPRDGVESWVRLCQNSVLKTVQFGTVYFQKGKATSPNAFMLRNLLTVPEMAEEIKFLFAQQIEARENSILVARSRGEPTAYMMRMTRLTLLEATCSTLRKP
jgi:hypothetical protein